MEFSTDVGFQGCRLAEKLPFEEPNHHLSSSLDSYQLFQNPGDRRSFQFPDLEVASLIFAGVPDVWRPAGNGT